MNATIVAVVAIAAGAAVAANGANRASPHPGSQSAVPHSAAPAASESVPPTPAIDAGWSAQQVERAFASTYVSYLDGRLHAGALQYASITSRQQALAGGQLALADRDGQLRLRSISEQAATLYSARAVAVAVNDAHAYPFAISLLLDATGWRVRQLFPPDLAVDDQVRSAAASAANMPDGPGRAAARMRGRRG